MGACCGKPDRKDQGYVLGSSNTSSNASATPRGGGGEPLGTAAGKAKAQQQQQQQSAGQTLGGSGSATGPTGTQHELSQSALAAQKRAEAAEKRGVQQGGGQLAKKLADKKKQSPYAVEESLPEPANAQWN
ncbi:hypothetical protein BGX33_009393 [Mortierella sp. NVP41]|nr:hypothetical protein BGX33_009393 [Mortierella sp. NVP41]